MARKKVKFASGLTVRQGDTVFVSVTGTYDVDSDTVFVRDAHGTLLGRWFDVSRDVANGEASIVKVKK